MIEKQRKSPSGGSIVGGAAADAAAPALSRVFSWKQRHQLIGLLFLLPAVVFVAVFYVYPILLNIVMIASNGVTWFLATGNTPATGYIFAWGLFAAGIAQYALLAVACRAASMRLVPRWPMLTPDVKRVIRLSVPGII